MVFTTTSWLVSGGAGQGRVVWGNSRCSILFHLEVPGGKWHTVISSPVSCARAARPAFQALLRQSLDPPASQQISSRAAAREAGPAIRACPPRARSTQDP